MTEMQVLINKNVDAVRDLILEAERWIWKHPETGYREWKTNAYMTEKFEQLGYELVQASNVPGFYTDLDTGRPGPKVLILGELDSLICADHPDADPETGAVHCCGHHAQCAALLGIAAALKQPGALDGLCGSVRLCAVPAEELIEVEFRTSLIREGTVRYAGGKTEFLYRGYFDGVDVAFMVHTAAGESFMVRDGSIGCMAKTVIYKGVSAHAGGAPWNGVNALYAATLGLQAINSIRETFQEKDLIRVHPIVTQGGNAVNAIPDRVKIESFVRGFTLDAIATENKKVNRALAGAAVSLGCNVDIQDIPGYAPLINNKDLIALVQEAAAVAPEIPFDYKPIFGTGSTDMGDISGIIPAVHPYAPGAVGKGHGSDYQIANPDLACVASAKLQLSLLALLLENDGQRAKEIVANFQPLYKTKEEYFACIDAMSSSGDRIVYGEDGTITVNA